MSIYRIAALPERFLFARVLPKGWVLGHASYSSDFFRQSGNPVKVCREKGLALPDRYRVAGSALLVAFASLGLASAHPTFLLAKKGRLPCASYRQNYTISAVARSAGSKPRALTHWKSVWNKT